VRGPPEERPSRSYRLKWEEGSGEGMRRIALGRAEKALEELTEAGDGDFAAAVHGARKDLKKLRAAARLIRDELGEKTFRAESRRYRDAGRLLSRSRDAEVKLETLAGLQERFGDELPAAASRGWSRALEADRDRLAKANGGETARQIEAARGQLAAGRARISGWSLEADSWKPISAGLSRSYRRGRQWMGRTIADPSAENVHEWRKRAKDIWYQLRIVRGAWPAPLGEAASQAHELADLLGHHHDLAMLREDLAERGEVERPGAFEASIDRRQGELLDEAIEIGRRFYAEKPKAFSRRLASYWETWREA
jgi:CHAD domain-containing protein